jgi:cohesin loading factor subunit SCC2
MFYFLITRTTINTQLNSMTSLMQTEEERVDGGSARVKMESDESLSLAKRISGDQDGDATLFGGVLTNHAGRLFDLTRSKESSIRFAVLKVIGILLRQGLVNPNEAIPYLFAMQGDTESQIRSLSFKFLSIEGEKRPDTLRRRVCAGVKHACEFQRLISNDEKNASSIIVTQEGKKTSIQCVFSRVFKECIASSRKQRHGFLKNLIGLFKLSSAPPHENANGCPSNLLLLSFASQILAHLEYTTADDPLFIIHQISSTVALQGTDTLDRMTKLLREVGLASADEYDDNLQDLDQLEKAGLTRFPSRTNEAGALSLPQFQLNAFADLCRKGIALSLLLRLKAFLRQAYNLSNTRCLEYDSNTADREADKSTIKIEISTPFDASIQTFVDNSGRPDKDALIRHYAAFRKLMREENSVDDEMIIEQAPRNEDTSK